MFSNEGAIKFPIQRLALFMSAQEHASLSEKKLSVLFAPNLAIDLMIQYGQKKNPLSFALLKNLLSSPSDLSKEIEAFPFTSNKDLNKQLLRSLILFYKKGILQEYKRFLYDSQYVKKFGAYLWDDRQILIFPFLLARNYDEQFIFSILSNEVYYSNLYYLIDKDPGLIQDIPQFFKDENQLKALKFFHKLEDKKQALLCLIFWVKWKEPLSLDEYKAILKAAKDYPLLAPTLVELDRIISIENLKELVFNPLEHLPLCIKHYFAEELKTCSSLDRDLSRLVDLEQLNTVSTCLLILKNSGIKEGRNYSYILKNDDKGRMLHLFLPQLGHIENKKERVLLINLLYAGIQGLQTQGKEVLALKYTKLSAMGACFQERFICMKHIEHLNLGKECSDLVIEEHSEKARLFRQVILRVKNQCKIIYDGLPQEVRQKWNLEEKNYLKTLYSIAYNQLMHPEVEIDSELKQAKDRVLKLVDPEIKSDLYKALIVISNILITILSLGIAPSVRYYQKGDPWFFNHTAAGEEVRLLDKEVLELTRLTPLV
jgi:hypothetical protein